MYFIIDGPPSPPHFHLGAFLTFTFKGSFSPLSKGSFSRSQWGNFSYFHFQRGLFPTFKRELFPLSMGELFLLSLSKGAFPHFQKGAFPTLNGGTFLTFTFTSTGGLGGLGDRQGTRVPLPIDNCLHKNCKCPGAALCIQILLRRWRQPESKNLFSMEITFLGCFHETSTLTIYDF